MSRTPNDLLARRTKSPIAHASARGSSSPATTALKHMFINKAERAKLMAACVNGDPETGKFVDVCRGPDSMKVSHLLKTTKPSLNPDLVRDSKLRTPLLVACAAGKADVVRVLIRWGADVNNPLGDIVGNRPLDLAVVSNSVDTVLALLEAGATVTPSSNPPAQAKQSTSTSLLPERGFVRSRRSPLDLAQSRLDMVIRQHGSPGEAANSKSKDQVIQIIKLLKYFVTDKPRDNGDKSDASLALDELTAKLSAIDLDEPSETKRLAETEVMKGLREVISNMKI